MMTQKGEKTRIYLLYICISLNKLPFSPVIIRQIELNCMALM